MIKIIEDSLPIKISDKYMIKFISKDDTEALFKIYSNEKIAKYVVRKTHKSISDTEEFIEIVERRMKDGNNLYLGVYDEYLKKLIGVVRFLKKEELGVLTLGYALNEDYWGRGILPVVVNNLIELIKLEGEYFRLRATIRPENINSQKCIEKLGFNFQETILKNEIIEDKEIATERLLYYRNLV